MLRKDSVNNQTNLLRQRRLKLSQNRFNADAKYAADVKSNQIQESRSSTKTQVRKASNNSITLPYGIRRKFVDDFRTNTKYLKSNLKEYRVINDYCRLCFNSNRHSSNDLQIFSSAHDLTKHVIKNHQFISSSFKCQKCSMSFTSEISLNIHQHFSHEKGQYGIPYSRPII